MYLLYMIRGDTSKKIRHKETNSGCGLSIMGQNGSHKRGGNGYVEKGSNSSKVFTGTYEIYL